MRGPNLPLPSDICDPIKEPQDLNVHVVLRFIDPESEEETTIGCIKSTHDSNIVLTLCGVMNSFTLNLNTDSINSNLVRDTISFINDQKFKAFFLEANTHSLPNSDILIEVVNTALEQGEGEYKDGTDHARRINLITDNYGMIGTFYFTKAIDITIEKEPNVEHEAEIEDPDADESQKSDTSDTDENVVEIEE